MNRMLIVDDEPFIVDGMVALFQEESGLELEIYYCYSGDEALELLSKHKIDVVLSDIRMPGLSGLQLLEHIHSQWPHCKVVFLTAHNDSDYIRQALRCGGVDYLLKTESEADIINSVRQALEQAVIGRENDQILETAKQQLKIAEPMLCRELLLSFCEGAVDQNDGKLALARELGLQLDINAPVLLVIGRVDRWREPFSYSDKALLRYAIENIMRESLTLCELQAASIDDRHFVCFLQPVDQGRHDDAGQIAWERMLRFVHGTLETVQVVCLELLQLPVSFTAGGRQIAWHQIHSAYKVLRDLLGRGLGLGKEILLVEGQEQLPATSPTSRQKAELRQLVGRISELRAWVEAGKEEPLLQLMQEVAERSRPLLHDALFAQELYFSISIPLLALISEWGKEGELAALGYRVEKLANLQQHGDYEEAFQFLYRIAEALLHVMEFEQKERTNAVVASIQRYINEHIEDDLSLTTLAGVVYLNANYLSRLYKQMTGISLSDSIIQFRMSRAKQLLQESFLRIHEIAKAVGFDNSAYFARVFRKHTGLTPQEYREMSRGGQ